MATNTSSWTFGLSFITSERISSLPDSDGLSSSKEILYFRCDS
jgi:hypothetical protein